MLDGQAPLLIRPGLGTGSGTESGRPVPVVSHMWGGVVALPQFVQCTPVHGHLAHPAFRTQGVRTVNNCGGTDTLDKESFI